MVASAKSTSALIALDSSCWLEVFDGGARAALYQKQAAAVDDMLVPVITVYEVFKYLRRKVGQEAASRAVTYMQRGQLVDIDSALVIDAATNGLPLADSLIYATTQHHNAQLWTQDAHFEGLPGVKYFPVKK
jgi:toxin FitB